MTEHPQLLNILRRWPIVIAATILGGIIGFGLSALATPMYQASSSLYFSINVGTTATDLNQGATYTQAQMLSFAQLAESPAVLDPVIDELKLKTTSAQLANSINVSTPEKTVVLNIVVTGAVPSQASSIANEVAQSVINVVSESAPRTSEGRSTVTVRTIQPATSDLQPSSPNTRINVVAGLLIGALLVILVIVVRSTTDRRVRDEESVAGVTLAPVLGTIDRELVPRRAPAGPRLALLRDPLSSAAESYRMLRSNLLHATGRPVTLSLVVTSAIAREGKSTVAANLAIAFGESGVRVILVDADLRSPKIAEYAELDAGDGLSTILTGEGAVATTVLGGGLGAVDVLTAGPLPANPGESLASDALTSLIAQLKKRYDVIILDTPPVETAADALVLATAVDGVLLVADRRRVHINDLKNAIEVLGKSGAHVLGIVLNQTPFGSDREKSGGSQGSSTTTEELSPLLTVTTKSSDMPLGTLNT